MSQHQDLWFDLPANDRAAWAGMLRTHSVVVRALDDELEREHGLSLNTYDVLVQLSLAGSDGMRMSELADAVLLTRAGITRLVERLERAGLVRRRPGRRDTRQVFASVTSKGLNVLAESTKTHLAAIETRFLNRLSGPQKQELARIWKAVLTHGGDASVRVAGNEVGASR